jgi:hypothetical protein
MFLDFHLEDQRLLYVPTCTRELEVCQIVPAKMTKRARRAAKKKGAELRVAQISE